MPAGWQCKAGTLARVSHSWAGVCALSDITGQGQDSSGAIPPEWLVSGHWRAAGLQNPSLPALETPLCCTFGSACGTLLWDEEPDGVTWSQMPLCHVPSSPFLPRPWDILLLDSLKWNRLALCLLAA